MNNIGRIVTILLSLLVVTVSLSGQEIDNKKKIDKMLEMGYYKIDITKIRPMALPSRTTMREYDITVKDHILTTELPYIGKFDSAPMSPQEIRVEIENQKIDYTTKYNEKKKRHEVRFRAKDDNSHDSVDFFLEIFENGTCVIRVSFIGRDPISYDGELKFIEQ